jgi:hypothetical protein
MRFLLLVLGCVFFSTASFAGILESEAQSFMPENDLHLEDHWMESSSNVTEEMFNRIIDTGKELYQPLADENDESLTINNKWSDSTVNANCSRFFGSVTINMFGGLARRPEVSPEAFALVLCHELGHAYGGKPYIRKSSKMSAEGQADYYGANDCLKKVIDVLEEEFPEFEPSEFAEDKCGGDVVCLRGLNAGQGLGDLLASMKKESPPDYSTPDTLVVKKTQLSYPKTVQCRLDTYLAGAMDWDRPTCWFKK